MSKAAVVQTINGDVDKEEIMQNFEKSIKLMSWLFKIMGMWPDANSIDRKFVRLLLIGVVLFFLMIFIVPVVLHTILVVKDFQVKYT